MLLTEAQYKNSHLFSEAESHSDIMQVLEGVSVEFSILPTDRSY